jgi:hypothetical protein
MKFLMVLLAVLQSSAPFQQAPPAQATATVEGFVVRAGTNEPISRVRVTAFKMTGPNGAQIPPGPRPAIPPVITDSQGHFIFKDLDPGSYLLIAQRNGFARQEYGGRAPGRPGSPLNVVAGQTLTDLVFHLIPGGTISGRVADATGEPLAGMAVQLVKPYYSYDFGKRTFQVIDSARTNDRGEYRIYWITPGRYYLSVGPNTGFAPYPNANAIIEPGYVLTYYPGTTDPSTAEAIEVQPGAELSTIDFTLNQQPLFRVRGRVFDSRTGQFPPNANVAVFGRSPEQFSFSAGPRNNSAADGTFEIRDVPPGSYWVRAVASDPRLGSSAGEPARIYAQVAVDVSGGDIENVSLPLTSGFQIQGRVVLDGGSPAALPDIERANVVLLHDGSIPIGAPQRQLKKDGLFTLEGIAPGEYRIDVRPKPANTFIESIRLGQTDVSVGLTISGPVSDPLEIVLSNRGGMIDGAIVDKDQKPMPGIQAVLLPDQRDRREFYRFANTDQNGHFTMRTIAPGDYKLFAWEDAEPGAYNDPEFLRKYEALATPVTISESATLSVAAKVLPSN